MPAFIHDRAEHILAKNPKMDKSQAFAIATQQSHALGKSPKKYGTLEGKATARKKYPNKKGYVKGANPGSLRTPKLEKRALSTTEKGKDEQRRAMHRSLGGATMYGGAVLGANTVSAGGLTGRERLYHGARADLVDKIREEGILPATETKTRGVTEILPSAIKRKGKGLAYATVNPADAAGYAAQADALKEPFGKPVPRKYKAKNVGGQPVSARNQQFVDLIGSGEVTRQIQNRRLAGAKDPGVLSIRAPTWKMELADNPEYTEFVERLNKLDIPPILKEQALAESKGMLVDSVRTAKKFGPEYIVGSSKYQRLGPKELFQYAKARPKTFAKNVGGALGAAALTALGGNIFYNAIKKPDSPAAKVAYAVSEFSGPLSYGPFKMESQIPPFRNPRVKTGGPPGQVGRVKKAEVDLLDEKLAELRKAAGIRDVVRGAVGKARGAADVAVRGASREGGEEFARGALKAVGEAGDEALKKYRGKLIGGAAGLGVAKGAYDAHRDKRVARNITSELRKHAYDPSPLGNVDMPGMSKMQTPAKQLQQSKTVAKIPATKPDAGKAFSTKLPTIGSAV